MDMVTADGYDLQFGTNVIGEPQITIVHFGADRMIIGHFLFTKLLMSALLAGIETAPDHHARIITTSSSAAMLNTIHWETLKDGEARRKGTINSYYAQSKFVSEDTQLIIGSLTAEGSQANVVIAREIAKRVQVESI